MDVNPVPSNTYHAADSGPVGYANLQPNIAPSVCDVKGCVRQATY